MYGYCGALRGYINLYRRGVCGVRDGGIWIRGCDMLIEFLSKLMFWREPSKPAPRRTASPKISPCGEVLGPVHFGDKR